LFEQVIRVGGGVLSIVVPRQLAQVLLRSSLMNKTKLLSTLALLSCLSVSAVAQERTRREPSPGERAKLVEPLIVESAMRYGIDPRILRAVCFAESRYRANAISPKGALGLMQFMPDTAAQYGLRNPFDPRAAIDAGARYLRDLLVRFNGRVDLAVAAYNAGEGAVQSFLSGKPLILRTGKVINPRGLITGGVPPYPETQNYVRAIVSPLMNERASVLNRAVSVPRKNNSTVDVRTEKSRTKNSYFIEVE
jgi:soluble lytic murein transglycosylase-like protein